MEITETKNEGLKRAYKITVPNSDIEERVSNRLGEIAQTARMPGFRPGKVPVNLLRKTHGNAIMGEVLEQTVNESSRSAISENDLRPVAQPKIEIDKFEDGEDLEYTIELEVFPEFTLTDFKSLKLERLIVAVDEEKVEATIQQIADSQKETKPVETKRKVKEGDVVVIDFFGRIDGVKEFEGGKSESYSLEIGSGSFIPGFEDQIVGHEPEDSFDVNVTFPENYNQELAGKDAVFDVMVKEIREKLPAAIDDEMAKKMGAEDLDDLRKKIRESQAQELGSFTRMRAKRDLLDILAKEHTFDVPEGMSEDQFGTIWEQFEHRREHNPDQIDEDDKDKSDEELKEQYRSIAERMVRLGLVLAENGRVNNIEVTPEEINRALMQEAQQHQGKEKEVLDYYKNNPEAMDAIKSPILEEKVVDFVLELADISEREVTLEELMKEPEDQGMQSENTNQQKSKRKKTSRKRRVKKSKVDEASS